MCEYKVINTLLDNIINHNIQKKRLSVWQVLITLLLILLGWQNLSELESNTERDRGGCGSCACVIELYDVNGIDEGINISLWPYDYIMMLQKLDIKCISLRMVIRVAETCTKKSVYIIYKVIKKSLCTWWLPHTSFLPHYVAQSDCLAVDRLGQGDTILTLTPSVIPNFNYVFMVSYWNSLKYFACFCAVVIMCTETFWSPCVI
jgi:hypothetical protein